MLAFSIDYYGIFFRATQSVELFCTYLRLSKISYDTVQKRYRIGRSGIILIMKRYNESGLSLDDLRQMPALKVVDLIYPKENLRHKDIPLPNFGKIHEQMVQMGSKR